MWHRAVVGEQRPTLAIPDGPAIVGSAAPGPSAGRRITGHRLPPWRSREGRVEDGRAQRVGVVRDALPDAEALAVAVAAELREPLDDVRPSELIATLVRRVDATSTTSMPCRGRTGSRPGVRHGPPPAAGVAARRVARRPAGRDARLAEAAPVLAATVAIQRAAGGVAARPGFRLVLFLARLAWIRRLVWDPGSRGSPRHG